MVLLSPAWPSTVKLKVTVLVLTFLKQKTKVLNFQYLKQHFEVLVFDTIFWPKLKDEKLVHPEWPFSVPKSRSENFTNFLKRSSIFVEAKKMKLVVHLKSNLPVQ